jgi:Fungal specific transcription factor domain
VPYCLRCTREGYTCDGYEKQIQFVHHEAPPSGESGRLLVIRNAPLHPRRKPASHGKNDEIPTFPFSYQQTKLSRGATESALFGSFWNLYTPVANFQSSTTQQNISTRNWAERVLTLSKDSTVLRNSLRAISLSCLASRYGNDVMSHQGAQVYGQSLVQLNAMLRDHEIAARSEAVLSASVLLALYEQFSCFNFNSPSTKAKSWIAHTEGITSLLQMRGPEAHTSADALHLLRIFRPSQLQYSLAFHKASPFASEKWCKIPWLNLPKTENDLLYDILLQIPGTLEKLELARSQTLKQLYIIPMAELLEFHTKLQLWFKDLTASLRTKMQLIETENEASPLAADVYMIHGIDIAESVMMFWAGSIIVLSILHDLVNSIGSEDIQHLSLSDILSEPTSDPQLYTSAIISTIKHFLHPSSGIASIKSVIIPVGTAIHYLVTSQARKSANDTSIPVPTGNLFSEENTRKRQPRDRLIDSREAHELSMLVFESSETNPWGALLGCFLLGMGERSGLMPERR